GDVEPLEEPVGARLDEAAHERAVLVERRLPVRRVLLERERELAAAVELADEDGEGAEAEAAERVVEMRRAHSQDHYDGGGLPPTWHCGHQYAVRALSPCGAEPMPAPRRGQARPARR